MVLEHVLGTPADLVDVVDLVADDGQDDGVPGGNRGVAPDPRFALVKPDRYIAAAVRPGDFRQLESLMDRFLARPAAVLAAG
jgi:hypothetical protein